MSMNTRERHTITDYEWEQMQPLLPKRKGWQGRNRKDDRLVISAILWVIRTGAPWRDLPHELGPWQTAYTRLPRWSKDGTWERIIQAVSQKSDQDFSIIDSTVVRAHQNAAGAARKKGINH